MAHFGVCRAKLDKGFFILYINLAGKKIKTVYQDFFAAYFSRPKSFRYKEMGINS